MMLLITRVSILLALTVSGSTPDEPRLPGAVESPPAWLKEAPFDLATFFALPPATENAAPLYLDALFEFAPEVAVCFPIDRRDRLDAVKDRSRRFNEIYYVRETDPKSVTGEQIDEIIAEFAEGLRKLDLAQSRPRCVFATDLSDDRLPPHAQSARSVVRVLRFRIERAVDRGDFDSAIADVNRMLRISRDLRPRGAYYSQLVGIAIVGSVTLGAIPSDLSRPGLTVEHCDRLLKVLAEHDAQAIDPYAEGVKGQYLVDRSFVRLLAEGIKMTSDDKGRPVETQLDDAGVLKELVPLLLASEIAEAMVKDNSAKPPEGENSMIKIKALIRPMIDDAERDPRWGDRFNRSMLAAKATHADRMLALNASSQPRGLGDPPAWFGLMAENYRSLIQSCSRDRVYLGAARCLIGIKRWRLTHQGEPTDLLEVCKAAGMAGVPFDPYSGSTLKMAILGGEAVIYSVGEDGRDDHALKDADLGRKPGTEGDFLFRFAKPK